MSIEGEKIIKTNNLRYPAQENDAVNILSAMLFIILIGAAYLFSRKQHHKHFSKKRKKK